MADREGNLGQVVIWGNGTNMREFLHARDCAEALIKIMESDINTGWVNVGSGEILSIDKLAEIIAKTVGYQRRIGHDLTKPNGSQRSVLDITKLRSLGWQPTIGLEEGPRELADVIFCE